MQLSLWLSKRPQCELVQVRFERAGKAPKNSYRGKSLMYQNDAGLFQWTAAVKAFAMLALGTRAAIIAGNKSSFSLSGEHGSPAAALDFAIAKPTSWIVDMFGRESSGKAYARIVFRRENSEQKRPGPVRISLSPQLFEHDALKVFYDGVEVVTERELIQLQKLISSDTEETKSSTRAANNEPVFKAAWFKSVLQDEINQSLTETNLLDPMTIRLTSERIAREKIEFKEEIETISRALLKEASPEVARYSKSAKIRKTGEIKKIACSPIAVASLCILHHVRNSMLSDATINASYPSSSSIVESGDINEVDAAVLSWGAALKLQRTKVGKLFRPVMILPRSTFGIVVPPTISSPLDIQKILLGDDPHGYPIEIIRRLKEFGRIPSSAMIIPAGASEMMSHLESAGDAAVIGFPLSSLLAKKYKAQILWAHDDALRIGDNILFLKNTIPSQVIVPAIRNAWFSLLDNTDLVARVSEAIYSDISFINYLYRQAALCRAS